MTYFLCLTFPNELVSALPTSFDSAIHFIDANNWPMAKSARGKNIRWAAQILQTGTSSAFLIAKASLKRNHNTDKTGLFIDGLNSLLKYSDCPAVSFLFHWAYGDMNKEIIEVKGECTYTIAGLRNNIYSLQDDIRYIIIHDQLSNSD